MSAWEMTTLALFPHMHDPVADMSGMDMTGMNMTAGAWSYSAWAVMIVMWWIMMIAMMVPSAAPTILLYLHVHRRALAHGQLQNRSAPTGAFAAGYLLIWLIFSIGAAALHWTLERAGFISPTMMGSQSRWLSGIVLLAAGIYQFSPLKHTCITHCRAPASFLARYWREGTSGALRLGALHGAYCVGCCWMLMALLFVGGVMNLAWVAALAVLVLIEKALPAGNWIGRGAGLTLIVWGVATLLI